MHIFGIPLSSFKDENDCFHALIHETRPVSVFTPNPEMLLTAREDPSFARILKKGDYRIPDGIGLYLAAQIIERIHRKTWHWVRQQSNLDADERLAQTIISISLLPVFLFRLFFRRRSLYERYGARICGSDLTKRFLEYASENGLGVTILDLHCPWDTPKESVQAILVLTLSQRFPWARFHLVLDRPWEREHIIHEIRESGDMLLLSTLGMGRQERSILDIMPHTPNIRWGLAVGSSIDYFTGFQTRAPVIWSQLGFEWLYRLVFGHRRWKRLKRIYRATVVFLVEVVRMG